MSDFRQISSMDADDRVGKYRKNNWEENIIQQMNEQLTGLNEQFLSDNAFPTILIIAPPRSGSTYLYQLLCANFDVGYPSNLMARFYDSPMIGAFLQKKLIQNRVHQLSEYKSVHGVTNLIEEPHEFGYFWSKYLQSDNETHEPHNKNYLLELNHLALEERLKQISGVFEKPVVYKCPLGIFFLPFLEKLDNVFFVFLTRNRNDNVSSILRVREERLGNREKWWSIRPQNYWSLLDLSPSDQVNSQLSAIEQSISEGQLLIADDRFIEISYEKLIKNKSEVIQSIGEKFRI